MHGKEMGQDRINKLVIIPNSIHSFIHSMKYRNPLPRGGCPTWLPNFHQEHQNHLPLPTRFPTCNPHLPLLPSLVPASELPQSARRDFPRAPCLILSSGGQFYKSCQSTTPSLKLANLTASREMDSMVLPFNEEPSPSAPSHFDFHTQHIYFQHIPCISTSNPISALKRPPNNTELAFKWVRQDSDQGGSGHFRHGQMFGQGSSFNIK